MNKLTLYYLFVFLHYKIIYYFQITQHLSQKISISSQKSDLSPLIVTKCNHGII